MKSSRETPFRVLVFSKALLYRHESIAAGIDALRNLGDRSRRFVVHATEDAGIFTSEGLKDYATLVFVHTIGPVLDLGQLGALQSYIRAGGGFVGIHGAAGGQLDSEWFGQLIGAQFDSHPAPEEGTLIVEDTGFELTRRNGVRERRWLDEWYNFKTHPRKNTNLRVLVRGDTSSFKGGMMGKDHPLVWCQEFEGGRSYFTALGHFDEAYVDDWFLDQLLRAILWTARAEGEAGLVNLP